MKKKAPKAGIFLEVANSNLLLGHSFTIFVSNIILIPFDLSSYKKQAVTLNEAEWTNQSRIILTMMTLNILTFFYGRSTNEIARISQKKMFSYEFSTHCCFRIASCFFSFVPLLPQADDHAMYQKPHNMSTKVLCQCLQNGGSVWNLEKLLSINKQGQQVAFNCSFLSCLLKALLAKYGTLWVCSGHLISEGVKATPRVCMPLTFGSMVWEDTGTGKQR